MWIYKWETSITGASLGGGHPLVNVYLWEKKVWPGWWEPWVNTIAYYPFGNDQLDATWNTTLSTQAWVQDTIWFRFTRDQNNSISVNWTNVSSGRWVSFYAKAYGRVWKFGAYMISVPIWWVVYYYIENTSWFPYMYSIQYRSWQSSWGQSSWRYPISNDTRYHFAYWIDTSDNITFYLNGVQQANFQISWYATDPCALWTNIDFTISEFILEDKARTAEEIQAYYNQTKSKYWI